MERPFCRTATGKAGWYSPVPAIVPLGGWLLNNPAPLAQIVTTEPCAAGLAVELRLPSWLSATADRGAPTPPLPKTAGCAASTYSWNVEEFPAAEVT